MVDWRLLVVVFGVSMLGEYLYSGYFKAGHEPEHPPHPAEDDPMAFSELEATDPEPMEPDSDTLLVKVLYCIG